MLKNLSPHELHSKLLLVVVWYID